MWDSPKGSPQPLSQAMTPALAACAPAEVSSVLVRGICPSWQMGQTGALRKAGVYSQICY